MYGCRRLITLCSSCARLLWLPWTIYLPFSIALRADSLGGYPCAWAAQPQANGEPPTRVSVAFGNSEEQLRGRNRQETNEPSDEIRCTSLSEFLSRVVNQVCSPHQRFDAGIHVRMSSIPFLAALLVERESRSLMTRHFRDADLMEPGLRAEGCLCLKITCGQRQIEPGRQAQAPVPIPQSQTRQLGLGFH